MMTQERAIEVFEACTKSLGPWSDQLKNHLTENENDDIKRLWLSDQYDGNTSFAMVFLDIKNGRVLVTESDETLKLCPDCLKRLERIAEDKYRKRFTVGQIRNGQCDRCTFKQDKTK